MHGVKRMIVFCILIVILPSILIIMPLYLRKTVFADVTYPVAESDIIEIRDGISSIFCQQHTLRMSSNFNAFQLLNKPEISTNRKHIRLKKSMTLPDDTLEYWGFYLLKGAKVHLKFCSRYDGSRILVVKGQRELKTCGLLDHNQNKLDANLAHGHEQVKVFFEEIKEFTENVRTEDLDTKRGIESDNYMEGENGGGEDLSDDLESVSRSSKLTSINTTSNRPHKKLKKGTVPRLSQNIEENISQSKGVTNSQRSLELDGGIESSTRHRRHFEINQNGQKLHKYLRYRQSEHERRKRKIYDKLYKRRPKRDQVYDRKYSHGGNAVNFTETDESNSISSFENGLFDCYNGDILLAEGFPPSQDCTNAHILENGSQRMLSKHEINEDGYYYYIFYSDNDLVRNDIHAIFDIYKPTFQYSNVSDSQGCVNSTNCTFSIGFLSDEIVVVEVPTRDGIEHEEDDITYLISTCHPRTGIYALFPITVLILILGCSFL